MAAEFLEIELTILQMDVKKLGQFFWYFTIDNVHWLEDDVLDIDQGRLELTDDWDGVEVLILCNFPVVAHRVIPFLQDFHKFLHISMLRPPLEVL